MKRIKEFLGLIKNIILFLFFSFWWVFVLILIWLWGYLISASNLPDWFKFFLLK